MRVLRKLDDASIVQRLTQVRGVGVWTVEMLLMFTLGRPDVLPIADLGVRQGFMHTYGLAAMPTPTTLRNMPKNGGPFRSVGSWYMWRAVELYRKNKNTATEVTALQLSRRIVARILAAKFEEGLSYADFLAKYGTPEQQGKWAQYHATVKLKPTQVELQKSWKREMKVLVLAGAWCGDCVNQCPMFDHFAQAAPVIKLRFFDRDAHPDLGAMLSVCGGAGVPVVLLPAKTTSKSACTGDRSWRSIDA